VRGTATFEILWWDVDVDFDESWGEARQLPATTVRVSDLVRAALADPANWEAAFPPGGERLVTVVTDEATEARRAVRAHPLGQLRIAQRVAPLELELDHLDDAAIDGANRIAITAVRTGTSTAVPEPARDQFTRARFQRLDDAARLQAKSFEPLPSGVLVGAATFVAPTGIGIGAGHETRLLGPLDAPPPPPQPPLVLRAEWLDWQLSSAPAALSALRTRQAMRPAAEMSLATHAVPMAMVHPGTLRVEPLDAEASRSPALAAQAAAAVGLRLLEAYETMA
jgi:hypothetical protein